MNQDSLAITSLAVRAHRRTLLEMDALTLGAGEVLTVLGPNGAGKSTLMRVISGLRRPTTGRVLVLGRPIHELGPIGRARLRRRIAYVPQETPMAGQTPLTLREVVAIGRTGIRGLFRPLASADWRIVDDAIERLGLASRRHAAYDALSGGEQRKTMLARALVQQPQMLLLDEPTAHLDLGWRENLVDTLDRLHAETRATMILVCHEPEVIPRCCHRVLLLDAGRIIADGPPSDVLSEARVAALYGCRLRVLHEHGRHAVVPAGERP